MIARRTRLAFLNKDSAIRALPRVVELMGKELNWSLSVQRNEVFHALDFLKHFGGPVPESSIATRYRAVSTRDMMFVFRLVGVEENSLNIDVNNWTVDRDGMKLAGQLLGYDLSLADVDDCFKYARMHSANSADIKEVVSLHLFADWWNSDHSRIESSSNDDAISENVFNIGAQLENIKGSGTIFG